MSESIKKLYYTISEVCEMVDLKQYVLRYWETEFDALSPLKNRSGNRIYTEEDIANVRLIKKLLYEEKYTIEGAKKRLSESAAEIPNEPTVMMIDQEKAKTLIKEIRKDIKGLMNELD